MNKSILIKKGLELCIIFLFIFSVIIPTVAAYGIKPNNLDNSELPTIPYDYPKKSPPLIIENIEGGLGLTVVIKNDGDIDVSDITLSINITEGYIIKPLTISYKISLLPAGKSIEEHIKIFGIGLGIVTAIPKIAITVSAPDIDTIKRIIFARILGPLVTKVGDILNDPRSFDGYTLFTPECSKNSYLINNNGEIVHEWRSDTMQGLAVYLLENGNLLRADLPGVHPTFFGGGVTGRAEILDWNGTLVWYFEYSTDQYCLHHDVEMLPNGNILMIAWERKTNSEATASGGNPALLKGGELRPDHIIEVEPTGINGGNIVWEWHVWDHLIQDYDPTKENYGVVADHPELIDINYGIAMTDWNHINSIDYNEEFDQILLSALRQNEIWVIDHSTTTEEAAGHTGGNSGKGGDILYRWGNPQAYRTGNASDQKFFRQHDAQWIESGCPGKGHILVFNNGNGRPDGRYSSVDEIIPPVDNNGKYIQKPDSAYGPENQIWIYMAEKPTDFYSNHLSGAQRLPNGNTLICSGANGNFFEVTFFKKNIVWQYTNLFPDLIDNDVFKIRRYAPDYPGLKYLFD